MRADLWLSFVVENKVCTQAVHFDDWQYLSLNLSSKTRGGSLLFAEIAQRKFAKESTHFTSTIVHHTEALHHWIIWGSAPEEFFSGVNPRIYLISDRYFDTLSQNAGKLSEHFISLQNYQIIFVLPQNRA